MELGRREVLRGPRRHDARAEQCRRELVLIQGELVRAAPEGIDQPLQMPVPRHRELVELGLLRRGGRECQNCGLWPVKLGLAGSGVSSLAVRHAGGAALRHEVIACETLDCTVIWLAAEDARAAHERAESDVELMREVGGVRAASRHDGLPIDVQAWQANRRERQAIPP